jgi:hypothetical protein
MTIRHSDLKREVKVKILDGDHTLFLTIRNYFIPGIDTPHICNCSSDNPETSNNNFKKNIQLVKPYKRKPEKSKRSHEHLVIKKSIGFPHQFSEGDKMEKQNHLLFFFIQSQVIKKINWYMTNETHHGRTWDTRQDKNM